MRTRLDAITIKGFKTIRELVDFRPGSLTVLIGPNGAGKSNFLSFFRVLKSMALDPFSLQRHVGQQGGASKVLHDGPAITPEIDTRLRLRTDAGKIDYEFRLAFAAADTLFFAEERFRMTRGKETSTASWQSLGAGHRSTQLLERETHDDTVDSINTALLRMSAFQFHDTSETSRMRTKADVNFGNLFMPDGNNIAAVLYYLKRKEGNCYRRIVETLRLILPFFSDFFLEPDNDFLLLAWRERNSDQIFHGSQAADGMLRAIALVTLLLLPDKILPNLLIIDEPELGLHPYAINVIGGLIRAVSEKVQVIVATQSTAFVDCFEPEDIVVVEREGRESTFRRLQNTEDLQEWLEEYSLSELWEKNVIGGRP
ncbi:MAG: AAA family ATPase [Caldilineaceae bacterium SB0665_bin_25]|nr:AAA family ATPase [Caldilineaceae bacterium SB0665_bin_25]